MDDKTPLIVRIAKRTGLKPWDICQQFNFARHDPRATLARTFYTAQLCRRLPDPQYRATARMYLGQCAKVRAGTCWGVSKLRARP